MAERGDAYALTTPVVKRRDTITSQLQREILGFSAAMGAAGYGDAEEKGASAEARGQGDIEIATPDKFARLEGAATSSTTSESVDASAGERRRTLSPTSASVLLRLEAVDDSAISRTDTVSPTAMRRVLLEDLLSGGNAPLSAPSTGQSAGSDEDVDLEQVAQLREFTEASRMELRDSPAASASPMQRKARRRSTERSPSQERALSSPAAATRSAAKKSPGKRARSSPSKRASPAKQAKAAVSDEDERRKSTTTDSFTDGLFSSSLLNQQAATEEDKEEHANISQQTTLVDSITSSPDRRATLEPTDAESIMAEMSETVADGAKPASNSATALRRQTIASHPVASSSSEAGIRRSTLDPRDVSLMQSEAVAAESAGDGVAAASEGLRRQTIGDSELEELNSVLGNVSMGDEAPSHSPARIVGARKRTNAFDATADEQVLKRAKTSSPSRSKDKEAGDANQRQSEKQRSPARAKSTGAFSSPSRIPRPRSSKAPLQSRSPDAAAIVDGDMTSPPAQGTRSKTPLRGILSARKRAKDQATPTKSVNFGPSMGAEFNHGSPSTSMTPMNANKARAMFPLDRPSTPDDEETSLNSSILDEADARSPDLDMNKKSQDDTLDGDDDRRSSLAVLKSANKPRRRYSLRGVSPLDNQREARRRRRASAIGGTSTTSTGISLPASQIPKPFLSTTASQSSFLADANVSLQDPTPYADSSASSDVGEDMELTGEHSFQASAVLQETINIMASSVRAREENAVDADEDDHTVELGSLGDLLAESASYELPSAAAVVAAAAASRINPSQDHEITLDPIQEEDESGANSSRQSMMSLASSADDSDADDDGERRTSLAINLSSQFERIGSASKTGKESTSTVDEGSAEEAAAIPPIELDELLSSVELDKTQTTITSGPAFFETDPETATTAISFLCSAEACSDVVEWHAKEISSWSAGLSDVLPALLGETAPSFLGDERYADDIKQAVKDLFAGEAASVRSGWCQWRARMETQMAEKLTDCANDLETDVASLKATVANDALQRQSEVAAIQELIERETQMAQLLDAIEEQQSVRNEYAAAVATLENQCSSLSLEESVLQTQLRVLEGRAHELEPVTASKSIRTQHKLLEVEEIFSIQESLSGWRIVEATSTHVKVSAKYEDVLFDVDVDISVVIHSPDDEGDDAPFSVTLKAREAIKRRKQSVYLKPDRDVVLLVQRQLFDSARLAVVVGEARGRSGAQNRHARLCSNVQLLQNYVAQSFQFLRELRELSMHLSLSLDVAQRTLWAQFIKFPPSPSEPDALGSKFRVGLPFGHAAPFASGEAVIDVAYGTVRYVFFFCW